MRSALFFALFLPATSVAAEPCTWDGSLIDMVNCIRDQAFDAYAASTCPDPFEWYGNVCVDLTPRGIGEVADTDVDTHGGATAVCTDMGGRLCTMAEVAATPGTGAAFGREVIAVWSSASIAGPLGYMRGAVMNTDDPSMCNEYQGEFYGHLFVDRDMCSPTPMQLDDDAHIDGFLCCH